MIENLIDYRSQRPSQEAFDSMAEDIEIEETVGELLDLVT